MANELSSEERRWVSELLAWDAGARRIETAGLWAALGLGALAVITAASWTLLHLTDRAVIVLTVPGFALGLALMVAYWLGSKRVADRHRVAGILRTLGAGAAV